MRDIIVYSRLGSIITPYVGVVILEWLDRLIIKVSFG